MWKVSWLYEKVNNFLVVPLYYMSKCCNKVQLVDTLFHNQGPYVHAHFYTKTARKYPDY